MLQSQLKFTVTNKTDQILYGEYLDKIIDNPLLKKSSCCVEECECQYKQIFAAKSAMVQVVLGNYNIEGVFNLRTGPKHIDPIKASFMFSDLRSNPNAVVESDEHSLAVPCNLARWQIATIIGVFGWLLFVLLLFTRTQDRLADKLSRT